MKQHYIEFVTQAQHQVVEPLLRSRIIAAAVAVAVAQANPLPSSEVSHAGEYFTNQVMPAAMNAISEFNENVVFDTRYALDIVRQLWQLRYWTAFQQTENIILKGECFFSSYTGIDVVISDAVRAFMDQNAKTVVSLSLFAGDALRNRTATQTATFIGG